MTSDPSDYHREYSLNGLYFLFQFDRSYVISVLKNSLEYSFVFVKCLIETCLQLSVSVSSLTANNVTAMMYQRLTMVKYVIGNLQEN